MKIFLKKNEERRLLAGHLWIFSNEIEKVEDYNAENFIIKIRLLHTVSYLKKMHTLTGIFS